MEISAMFDESVMQYTPPGESGEQDVVIGLDFGTSASKVVISLPGSESPPAFAVDFGLYAHSSMPYLLPTRIWVSAEGSCSLEKQRGAHEVKDIKIELFTREQEIISNRGPTKQSYAPEDAAIAYLALLLRYARLWFMTNKAEIVRHYRKLIWSVNLGVPSPCIEDTVEQRRFKVVGRAAWRLSLKASDVQLCSAKKEREHIEEGCSSPEDGGDCWFALIPEGTAGAIGYAWSPGRRNGLHLLVDIGASTVDVCSIIIHNRGGEDRYSLLDANVKHYGTIRLHQVRIQSILSTHQKQAQALRDEHDPLAPITNDIKQYLPTKQTLLASVDDAESVLRDEMLRMLKTIIANARRHRDPMANAWITALPVILIGGGSRLEYYRKIVEDLGPWLSGLVGNRGISIQSASIPVMYGYEGDDHDRLMVAWGLSHPEYNIGTIKPADKIDDVSPAEIIAYEHNYISHDHV